VKGGEDLRNDERIEQLLTLMNSILSNDGAASGAGLKLRTYSVVPMTTEVPNEENVKKLVLLSLNSAALSILRYLSLYGQEVRHGFDNITLYMCVIQPLQMGVMEWVKHTHPVKAVLVESLSTDTVFRAHNAAALSPSSSSKASSSAAAAATGPVDITNPATFAACAEYMKITKGKLSKEDFHEVRAVVFDIGIILVRTS